jgi:hypothetical protein
MPHSEFLISCSRLSPTPLHIKRIKETLDSDFDWDQIMMLANREGITPLLYHNLKAFTDKLPSSVSLQLKKIYFRVAGRNTYLFKKLLPLLDAFDNEGLRVGLSRGARLIETVYHDWGLRYFHDIDFMIHPGDAFKLLQILKQQGLWEDSFASLYPTDNIRKLKWIIETGFEKNSLVLDFHCSFPGIEIPIDSDPLMWESTQIFTLFDRNVRIFSAEYELCLLCLHVQKHFYSRLIWLADIAELSSSQEIDWGKVANICKSLEITAPVFYGLYLINCLWPQTIPESIVKKLEPGRLGKRLLVMIWPEDKIVKRTLKSNVPARASSVFLFLSLRRLPLKIKTLFSIVFPPRAYVAYAYGIPINSTKIYGHYLWRFFRPITFFLNRVLKK